MTPTAPARTLLALVVLTSLAGCKTPEKKDEPIVRKLRIEGAQQVKESAIKKKILTAETGWIPFISKPQYFDPDIWRTDLRRIERYYRERGYYQAEVVEDHIERKDDHVELDVRVSEGKPTAISEVSVSGLDALPPEHRARLERKVTLKPGQIFIEDDWEGLKGQLTQELRELGYIEAKVEGKAYVDVATQQARIDVRVTPGQRYRFGELKLVTGKSPEVEGWRILEQARAKVKPGDWYSESALSEAQARVFKMGVFGAAKVRPDTPDPSTDTAPIIVDVREAPFHSLRLGLGAHLDQSRNEGRLTADYTDRDFLGALRRLNLHADAGWAFIPTAYAAATGAVGAKNGPIARLSADLQQPRLGVRDFGLETRLELERGIEPAYSFYGGRGRLGVNYRPSPYLALTLAYNLELYQLEEGEALLGGTAPALLFGCPNRCILSYLEQRVEWDHRDNKQEPKRGYYLALGVQEGGGPLGGSFKYLRVLPEARGYATFLEGDALTVAARLRLGTLIPASGNPLDSPIVTRFYAGGADSMRGFSARRLSPLFVESLPDIKGGYTGYAVPVGGNGLVEGTLEARYNVWGPLVAATFLDTGLDTSESLQPSVSYFAHNLYYAVGAGVRYRTPVGPIRLDFAYRLPIGPPLQVYQAEGTTLTYPSEGTCFGIGNKPNLSGPGAPEGPCTIHVSIGEAF